MSERGYPRHDLGSSIANSRFPVIVCLCGSTRFYPAFQEANYRETMAGKIVLSVGFYPHGQMEAHGETMGVTPEQKEALDRLHFRKIDLADEVLVLNVDGYVGESTRNEIAYSLAEGKALRWLDESRGGDRWLEENAHDLGKRMARFIGSISDRDPRNRYLRAAGVR